MNFTLQMLTICTRHTGDAPNDERQLYNEIKVCCWFFPLLQEVFLQVLLFSPLFKNQHFQIPI